MPRYDFKCRTCSYVFEAITSSDVVAIVCVACNPTGEAPLGVMPSIADRQLSVPASIQIH